MGYLKIILFLNGLQLLRALYFYRSAFKNKNRVLKVAEKFKHSIELGVLKNSLDDEIHDELMFFEVEPTWGLRVSSYFYDL